MDTPLVSILIPFKNSSEFLPECLESILNQEYTNWEVIAVNDESTDTSKEIVTQYSALDPRIKVTDNVGSGIIKALRLGYAMSAGGYITRMDSDDIMTPVKLRTLVSLLGTHGKGHIAVGKVCYFSASGISNGYKRYEDWLNRLTDNGANFNERYKECVIPSPCWMVYRDDLDQCGAFENDIYPEDYDLAFRMFENGLQCIPCSDVLHLWRDYATRTSRTSEHYAQNYFLDLKLFYFLKLDWDTKRPLVLWGAGNKGKTIGKALIEKAIPFTWVCDNPNKIGKNIYGVPMLSYLDLKTLHNTQSIITVANEQAQMEIHEFFKNQNQVPMKDYYFFC
jgi:glycosyltransferase involved in cell wall biosynthesis